MNKVQYGAIRLIGVTGLQWTSKFMNSHTFRQAVDNSYTHVVLPSAGHTMYLLGLSFFVFNPGTKWMH